MKQPALGIKIQEIRNQKSITQKELSGLCNVDFEPYKELKREKLFPGYLP